MAIGRRRKRGQQEMFVAASEIRVLANPFYRALNKLLDEAVRSCPPGRAPRSADREFQPSQYLLLTESRDGTVAILVN